jgi:predicted kinase
MRDEDRPVTQAPLLVVFGGLPGTGKTTLAARIAAQLPAAYLRIDAIEAAMWRAGLPRGEPTGLAAYLAAEAMADASLRSGCPIVIDAVNPIELARRTWRELARRTGSRLSVIEVVCSDRDEHRRRVEERAADLEGHSVPTWSEVEAREYDPWQEPRLVVDTSVDDTDGCVRRILAELSGAAAVSPDFR